MQRLTALLLAALLLFSMTACGQQAEPSAENAPSLPVEAPEAVPEIPEPEPEPEPAPYVISSPTVMPEGGTKDGVTYVEYNGVVEHLFFHPVIAYPEQAFDGDHMSNGYDDWMVTVGEYNKILQSLYDNGYILVDMELVPRIVDLMGGVDVHLEHHIRVHTDGVEVYVPAGDQHLNGEEVLATLRYRYGYANADLGRVEVQRMVITECMKQWVHPAKLALLPDALSMIQEESLTDLSVNNFLWIGKTILLGLNDLSSDTLPGYADMRGGASYFILYRDQVAELVNQSYNPYTVDVDADDLEIAE